MDDQIDQRLELRRAMDRRLVAALVTAVTIAVSFGVAWGTSTAALGQKVDKVDQVKVDAAQDLRLNQIEAANRGMMELLRDTKIGVDSANLRLRQMKCEGQGPSCR
jgi:hypothetical protein